MKYENTLGNEYITLPGKSLSLIHPCSPVHHPRATLRSLTAGPEGAGKYGLLEDSDALFTREPSHRESHMVL